MALPLQPSPPTPIHRPPTTDPAAQQPARDLHLDRLVAGLVELDRLGPVHAAEVGSAVLQRELDLPLRQLRPALLTALAHRLERVLLEVHVVSVKRLYRRMSD